MARIPRGLSGSGFAHVLNRGNAKAKVFFSAEEYRDFIGLLREAATQFDVELLAFCLMPNHFHLVARFDCTDELSGLMQWWMTSHVRRHHERHRTSGHVWQGRYKCFPVQGDEHLLRVFRYVLLNSVRAGLAVEANDWPWSSLSYPDMTAPWPVEPPANLRDWLSAPQDGEQEEALRESIKRSAPYGDEAWCRETARAWGLEPTLRPIGRPKEADKSEPADADESVTE